MYNRQSMPSPGNRVDDFTLGENSNFYSEEGVSQKYSNRKSRSNSGGGEDAGLS